MNTNLYTYCLLKYKHSPFLEESLNIGVLIYFYDSKRFVFKYSKTLNRVKCIYENVPEKTIKEYTRQIDRILNDYQNAPENLFPLDNHSLKYFLSHSVLPNDATVLQFSNYSTDYLRGFEEEFIVSILLDKLFIEDIKSTNYKPQEPEIIKNLFNELNNKGFSTQANTNRYRKDWGITSNTGNFNFDFAWKNGVWNLVKPVGFDLKTTEGIINKARTNLGEFTDLYGEINKNEYKCNIIVGRPTDRNLFSTYDKALTILQKSPNTDIVEENELKKYSEKVLEAVSKNDM